MSTTARDHSAGPAAGEIQILEHTRGGYSARLRGNNHEIVWEAPGPLNDIATVLDAIGWLVTFLAPDANHSISSTMLIIENPDGSTREHPITRVHAGDGR